MKHERYGSQIDGAVEAVKPLLKRRARKNLAIILTFVMLLAASAVVFCVYFFMFPPPSLTVKFEAEGISLIPQKVYRQNEESEPLSLPEPARAYYVFGGWYIDKDCTEPFDLVGFNADLLSGLFTGRTYTLYAKWKKAEYELKFDTAALDSKGARLADAYRPAAATADYVSPFDKATGSGKVWAKNPEIVLPADSDLVPNADEQSEIDGILNGWYIKDADDADAAPQFVAPGGRWTVKGNIEITPDIKPAAKINFYIGADETTPVANYELAGSYRFIQGKGGRITAADPIFKAASFNKEFFALAGWSDNAATPKQYILNGEAYEWADSALSASTAQAGFDLYAYWVPLSYRVTFNLNVPSDLSVYETSAQSLFGWQGRSSWPSELGWLSGLTAGNSASILAEDAASGTYLLPDAARIGRGYDKFLGWYADAALTNGPVSGSVRIAGDTVFYAKWSAVTWELEFDLNGGTPPDGGAAVASRAVAANDFLKSSVPLAVTQFKTAPEWTVGGSTVGRLNYPGNPTKEFLGWFTWDGFLSSGGKSFYEFIGGKAFYEATAPASAEKTVYDFFKNEETYNPDGVTVIKKILYAKFQEEPVTFRFLYMGVAAFGSYNEVPAAALDVAAIRINVGEKLTYLPENPTSKTDWTDDAGILALLPNYSFGGWFSLDAGALLTLPSGGLAASPGMNSVYYAKFTPKAYSLTLNRNDGTGGAAATHSVTYTGTAYTGAAAYASGGISAPKRDDYDFLGWYRSADASGAEVNLAATTAAAGGLVLTENTTLYAKWRLKQRVVTFNANGGAFTQSADGGATVLPPAGVYKINPDGTTNYDQVNYGGSGYDFALNATTGLVELTAGKAAAYEDWHKPENSPFVFAGWYLDKACKTKVVLPLVLASDITLYAGWTFTLKYDLAGATLQGSSKPADVVYVVGAGGLNEAGGALAYDTDLIRAVGYTFGGWFLKQPGATYHGFAYNESGGVSERVHDLSSALLVKESVSDAGKAVKDFISGTPAVLTLYAKWVYKVKLNYDGLGYDLAHPEFLEMEVHKGDEWNLGTKNDITYALGAYTGSSVSGRAQALVLNSSAKGWELEGWYSVRSPWSEINRVAGYASFPNGGGDELVGGVPTVTVHARWQYRLRFNLNAVAIDDRTLPAGWTKAATNDYYTFTVERGNSADLPGEGSLVQTAAGKYNLGGWYTVKGALDASRYMVFTDAYRAVRYADTLPSLAVNGGTDAAPQYFTDLFAKWSYTITFDLNGVAVEPGVGYPSAFTSAQRQSLAVYKVTVVKDTEAFVPWAATTSGFIKPFAGGWMFKEWHAANGVFDAATGRVVFGTDVVGADTGKLTYLHYQTVYLSNGGNTLYAVWYASDRISGDVGSNADTANTLFDTMGVFGSGHISWYNGKEINYYKTPADGIVEFQSAAKPVKGSNFYLPFNSAAGIDATAGNLTPAAPYSFAGWYSVDAAKVTVSLTAANIVAQFRAGNFDNGILETRWTDASRAKTYYAKWTYNIKYDLNDVTLFRDTAAAGTTVPFASGETAVKGSTVALGTSGENSVAPLLPLFGSEGISVGPAPDYTVSVYNFDGWYKEAAFTSIVTTYAGLDASLTAGTPVTLYAKWTVTVTYNLDGKGTLTGGNSETFNKGAGTGSLPAPTPNTGFTFAGWYLNATHTGSAVTLYSDLSGNATLFAKYAVGTP